MDGSLLRMPLPDPRVLRTQAPAGRFADMRRVRSAMARVHGAHRRQALAEPAQEQRLTGTWLNFGSARRKSCRARRGASRFPGLRAGRLNRAPKRGAQGHVPLPAQEPTPATIRRLAMICRCKPPRHHRHACSGWRSGLAVSRGIRAHSTPCNLGLMRVSLAGPATRAVAAIAQAVEHLIRNEGVGGSSPSCGTIKSETQLITSLDRWLFAEFGGGVYFGRRRALGWLITSLDLRLLGS